MQIENLIKSAPDFEFPTVEISDISGRAKVYKYIDNSNPLTTLKLIFHRGASADRVAGHSSFSSQLMLKGTLNYSASKLSELIDSMGAAISINSSHDDVSINATFLSIHSEKVIELLRDIILNSAYLEDEFIRHKKKYLSHIRQELADADYLADIALTSSYFSGHPYGKIKSGTINSISSISFEESREWYRLIKSGNYYSGIISGFVEENGALLPGLIDIINSFELEDSDLNGNSQVDSAPNLNASSGISLINKSGAMQTALRFALPAPSRDNSDYPAYQLANVVFGGYFNSRLNRILREEMGLTYGIHSYVNTRKLASTLIIGSGVNQENTRIAIETVLSELDRFSSGDIDNNEFKTAQQYMLGSFIRNTEVPQQIAGLIKTADISNLELNYFNEYYKKIAELNIENIRACVRKYFIGTKPAIAASGNLEFLRKELSSMDKIEIYSEEGMIVA